MGTFKLELKKQALNVAHRFAPIVEFLIQPSSVNSYTYYRDFKQPISDQCDFKQCYRTVIS